MYIPSGKLIYNRKSPFWTGTLTSSISMDHGFEIVFFSLLWDSLTRGHPYPVLSDIPRSHPYQSQPSRPIVAPKGGWTTAPLLAQCPPSKATFCLAMAAWNTFYILYSLPKLQMVLNILHAPFLVKFGMVFCVLLGLPLGATGTLPLAQNSLSTLRSNTLLDWLVSHGHSGADSKMIATWHHVWFYKHLGWFQIEKLRILAVQTSTLTAFPLPRISRLWTQGTQNTTRVGTWKTTRLGKFFNYGNPQKDWQATPYWNSGDMMCFSTFLGGC